MILLSTVKLPTDAKNYLVERKPQWSEYWHYTVTCYLARLYLWLRKKKLRVNDLTPRRLQSFFDDGHSTSKNPQDPPRVIVTRAYLIWLAENKRARIDPDTLFPEYMARWDRRLPPLAERFYQERALTFKHPMSHRRLIYAVNRFHRWIKKDKVTLKNLKRHHLERFRGAFDHGHQYTASSHHGYFCNIRIYLDWLIDHGHIEEINIEGLFPKGKDKSARKLTDHAKRYMALRATIIKPRTLARTKYVLGTFNFWLHENKIEESKVTRIQTELWLQSLASRGLVASTRTNVILELRSYFYWLNDQGFLKRDPASLLRRTDIPKRPKLLPRPLPPEIDLELTRRLEASNQLLHQGLLVLRYTGIRVGDLIEMPWSCVKQDFNGDWTLKVPLGKLNMERLIPVDSKTLQLIRSIQEKTRPANEAKDGDDISRWLLFPFPHHNHTQYAHLRLALKEICRDFPAAEPIVIHRLRHTYATSLLNAGMSLVGVMRLLGHRSITTTLIYAAVAQETVREEFISALDKIQTRYQMPRTTAAVWANTPAPDGLDGISDTIRWLHQQTASADKQKALLLLKRLHRMRSELQDFQNGLIAGRSATTSKALECP